MNISRKSLITGALILLAAQILFYHPAITQGYFHADDWFNHAFYQEYSIGDYTTGDWGQGRRGEGGYYRPMSRLYFNVNFAVFGLWAPGHHASNFLLHFANVLLFWAVARRLMRTARAAFAAALLFLLFPAHPSAVHWISGATDLIHAFWYLAAINLALAMRMGKRSGNASETKARWQYGIGVMACFAGALISKETAVGLPFVLLAIEWTAAQSAMRGRTKRKPNFLHAFSLTLAAFTLLTAYFIFRRALIGGAGYHLEAVMGRGILAPSLLSFLSSLITLVSPPWSPANLAAYLIVLAALIWPLRRTKGGIIAAVWLMMAIAPMAGIVVSIANGGWLLYLPAAAWCVVLVMAADRYGMMIFKSARMREQASLMGIAVAIVIYAFGANAMERQWARASTAARTMVRESVRLLDEHAAALEPGVEPAAVIVPNLVPPAYFPSPIFHPAYGLHMALESVNPDKFKYRDSIEEGERSGALVLMGEDRRNPSLIRFAEPPASFQVSLFQIQSIERREWTGREMRESWEWGSGVVLDGEAPASETGGAAMQINDPESAWALSPDMDSEGAVLNLLILDYETLILTEGMAEWIVSDSGYPPQAEDVIHERLIYNDPASRDKPRRITAFVNRPGAKVRVRLYPIREPGAVAWRQVEWRQYRLEALGQWSPASQ